MTTQYSKAISERYDVLSGQECCLSCGGAIGYADIQPGFFCADLGSGKGFDVLKMATKAGPKGFVYGVDVSDEMMETARNNVAKLNLKNVDFVKSELENIDLPDGKLDFILSNCTINHSLDQAQVWKEVYRLLKPGGSFIVSDIFALEDVPEEYRTDPVAVAECWAGSVTKEKYMENLQNAGFETIDILEESKPYDKGKVKVCSFTIKGVR